MLFNINKLKQMIVFISKANEDNPRFGSTVLNKMLWYSDFYWFGYTGKSISNDNYVKREFGPTPQNFLQARRDLIESGILTIEDVSFYGKPQKRPIVKHDYEDDLLSKDEKDFIMDVVKQFRYMTGKEISEASHTVPWQIADEGDIIPYETIHGQYKNFIPKTTFEWAMGVIKEL